MTTDVTEFRKQIDAIKSEAEAEVKEVVNESTDSVENVESEGVDETTEETQEEIEQPTSQEQEEQSEESAEVLEKGLVPRGRLNKEIKKAKEIESALNKERQERQQERERLLLAEQRMKQLEDAIRSMNQNKPDPEVDPEAYEQYQKEEEKKQLESKLKEFEEFKKQSEQQQVVMKITEAVAQDIKIKMSEKPDVVDAYNYLVDAKRKEMAMISRDMNELNARVDQYLLSYAVPALHKGVSPADIFYQLAQTFGYKGKKTSGGAPSIDAIESNKKKVAPPTPEKARSDAGFGGSSNSVNDAMNKNGRGVDPAAFQKMLKNLQS